MFEGIILGIVQGITEWLPVSSEGALVLAQSRLFGGTDIKELIQIALFLHLGTFLAALIYLRSDVAKIFHTLPRFRQAPAEQKKLTQFLIIATLIGGIIGYMVLYGISRSLEGADGVGIIITAIIGTLLLITGIMQLKAKSGGQKSLEKLSTIDAVILGIVQGFAALPGLSRSGLTVSALLLRKFDETLALKVSFLMSLPIVLGGNIILNWGETVITQSAILGLIFSFLFGFITIDILMKTARKVNFGYFVILFGIITILSILV